MNRKSDAIYAMIRSFKRRGIPIDGVGLQMHIPLLDADIPAIAANIARLTALGVQVHVTELDVSLFRSRPAARFESTIWLSSRCLSRHCEGVP